MADKSREEILRRIKSGLQSLTEPAGITDKIARNSLDVENSRQKVVELKERLKEKRQTLVDRFIEEFSNIKGIARAVGGDNEVRESILRLTKEHDAECVTLWESDFLRRLNLRELFEGAGFKLAPPGNKEETAKAGVGITEADFAIAATGTMVLMANKRQPRSVSLIPPVHVAIIRSDVIVENISDLFLLLEDSLPGSGSIRELTSCMTFVTGPSRTADIELNLTLGVHGPKEVFALVYS